LYFNCRLFHRFWHCRPLPNRYGLLARPLRLQAEYRPAVPNLRNDHRSESLRPRQNPSGLLYPAGVRPAVLADGLCCCFVVCHICFRRVLSLYHAPFHRSKNQILHFGPARYHPVRLGGYIDPRLDGKIFLIPGEVCITSEAGPVLHSRRRRRMNFLDSA